MNKHKEALLRTFGRWSLCITAALCAACSTQAVKPPMPATPLLTVPTVTPVSPAERLKWAARNLKVWGAAGSIRWVRPGQDIQERGFVWRESSGAWAVGVRQPEDESDANNNRGDENGTASDNATPKNEAISSGEVPRKGAPTMDGGTTDTVAADSAAVGAMASERGVFLVHANGQADPIADTDMTAVIHTLWGDLPVDQLRAWVLALPSHAEDAFTYYPNGLPSGLTPKDGHGWTVVYRGWLDAKPQSAFPQNVLLKGPDGTELEIRFDYVMVRQPLIAPPGLSF